MGLVRSNMLRIERGLAALNAFGWTVTSIIPDGNSLTINLTEEGSLSIGAILAIIFGILAAVGIISFSWKLIEEQNTIQQAEQTEQDALNHLRSIVDNPELPIEIREDAAAKLIELATPVITEPPALPGEEKKGGFFEGGFLDNLTPMLWGMIAVSLIAAFKK